MELEGLSGREGSCFIVHGQIGGVLVQSGMSAL